MPRRKREGMPRVLQFVHEYVWGKHAGHITNSALAAGFGKGDTASAANYGCELLRRPKVKALVDAELAEKRVLFKQKALRVAEETFAQATARLTDAFDANGDFKPMKDWPDELQRALVKSEVEVIKFGTGGTMLSDGAISPTISGRVLKIAIADKKASQELYLKWAGELNEKLDVNHNHEIRVIDPYAEKQPSK